MPQPVIDETGKRFGRLVVIERAAPRPGESSAYWRCRCDCGNTREVIGRSLRNGHTVSCGCFNRDQKTKHGRCFTKEYAAWAAMRSRCQNPKHKAYGNYGGRGIKVCDRWQSFDAFFADMGVAPEGTELDRKDNDGNYEPNNCRWVTVTVQNNNRRTNRYIELNGTRRTLAEWVRVSGISRSTLKSRLARKLPLDQVFAEYLNESRTTAASDLS